MDVAIIGIGIHPFGRTEGVTGLEQGVHAAREALKDVGLDWNDMEFAYGGSSAAGNADSMVSKLGLTGLQFINVSNGCATGGSALQSAYMAIQSGMFDIGMAVGFDKHPRGAFTVNPEASGLGKWYGDIGMALTPQFFGMKIQRYMHEYDISEDTLIRVAVKNFKNGAKNPNAWRRNAFSYDDVAQSQMVCHPLRKYMFCSPAEGGCAMILCRADKAKQYTSNPVFLKAVAVKTRQFGSFEVFSQSQALERAPAPTVQASTAAFEMAGIGPEDIDVAQLQDTESGAEIMHMAENGFCADGDQEKWLREGHTEIDGKLPVNTDGGCLANGEPVGASGLRQVYEICLQLRGEAGERQVPNNPKTGYTHVYGAPGLSGVTIMAA
ncbi:MAG: thiolase family protein [Gammaproteobacteria bacterium]|nr:thiolase family protein [Gammaproteobacteria bacterium]MDE0271101.1 thiolase family protein [Gammaproteobacteria bacterium]